MVIGGSEVFDRSVVLPPDPRAPRAARQLVRDTLLEAGRADFVDAAELAVSEVVTNATLHARTDIAVSIAIRDSQVRVEVRDLSTVLPRQRHYGEHATTGRGMALVASLSTSCGVTELPAGGGKIVWFVLGAQAERSVDDILASFDDDQWDLPERADPSGVVTTPSPLETPARGRVELLGIPPTLWLATRRHHDAMLRELVLYTAGRDDTPVDFAGAERARHIFSNAVIAAVEDAHRDSAARRPLPPGHPSPLAGVLAPIDVRLDVPAEAGPAAFALQDALDTAERLAREGRLLTFPAQPEMVAVRDWLCEQVQSQLHGIPPRPWIGAADKRFESVMHPRPAQWDSATTAAVSEVVESDRGVVASDEGNRILAISRPLAAALGWEVADLLGQRIVVLIPPALREAHIAGFSRHLSTGESHVLGVPLTLPVLHADGSTEILCTFMVERVATAVGRRSLFRAWIDPVGPAPA